MAWIYKITSPSKRMYIGSTIDYTRRFNEYKKMHCKGQLLLYKSFLKYGVQNHQFEIICECSEDEMKSKESYYGILFNSLNPKVGLNLALPKHGEKFAAFSVETRKKISVAMMGNTHFSGKKLSERHIEILRNIKLGVPVTQAVRDKISKSKKGVSYQGNHYLQKNPLLSLGEKNNFFGRYHSLDTLRLISSNRKGKNKGSSNTESVSVMDKITGEKFTCIRDAAKSIGIARSYLSRMLSGSRKNVTNLIYAT